MVWRHACGLEKKLKHLCCFAAALPFSGSKPLCPGRWLISAVCSIDGCMNAPQPLKVIFVVFFLFFFFFQVVNALESNPTARRTQLHHKFEQVIALVEDNIYECCSEA